MDSREEIIKKIISLALEEDLSPNGDISLAFLENPEEIKTAQIIAKEPGVMACSWIAAKVLDHYKSMDCFAPDFAKAASWQDARNDNYSVTTKIKDGENFSKGDVLMELQAPVHYLLSCERTILNFLQRLCAIASAAHKLTQLIKNYPCELLDTRKTMPGLRALEKEAFKTGGGKNHRFNLSDAVMLKENHLAVIKKMDCHVDAPRLLAMTIVEINKENLNQLEDWLKRGINQIMLDNFSPEEVARVIQGNAWQTRPKKTKLEVSGGITAENIEAYAKTGVDYISTSSCMTKVFNLDLSMLVLD